MAKKSQTRARRNNTQVGSQVVNFYNHGTVNVDARQNNSTSPKSVYSYCTIYEMPQSGRAFTLKDQLEDGHPILDMTTPEETMPTTVAAPDMASSKNESHNWRRPSRWGWIAGIAGIAMAAATVVASKYLLTK